MHSLLRFWPVAIVIAFPFLEWALFSLLPRYAVKLTGEEERRRAIRFLEQLMTFPSLSGDSTKLNVRLQLAHCYFFDRRYADAVRQCETILQHKLPISLEAEVRRQLADALEGSGQIAASKAAREGAQQALKSRSNDVLSCLAQGKMLERDNQYADACIVYERGLTLAKSRQSRMEVLGKILTTSFQAGQPERTITSAAEMLALGVKGPIARAAHSMAGEAHKNLGHLEEAEDHYRKGYALALEENKGADIAHSMAQLAGVLAYRGRLDEALQMSTEGIAHAPGQNRVAYVHQCIIWKYMGRYDEAQQAVYNAQACPTFPTPSHERRTQAINTLLLAGICAEIGEVQRAKEHWDQGAEEFRNDAKLRVYCHALGAWIVALLGRSEEAQALADSVERELPTIAGSRTSLLDAYSNLTRAAMALQNYAAAEQFLLRYLELKPYPVDLVTAYFFLGECRHQQSDRRSAIDYWQQALALNINSLRARQAQTRLSEASP